MEQLTDNTIKNLHLRGVYKIVNITTGKIYIGSTTMSFLKRLQHHHAMLQSNKHKNIHLQRAWNKYGSDDFIFDVIEICKKDQCLLKEQYWMNYYDIVNKGYNINPLASGTPNMSRETIDKRSKTFKITINEAVVYYREWKNNEILYSEIPKKYIKLINWWYGAKSNDGQFIEGKIPWNKGIKYESTDHLKVPKTISKEWLENRKQLGLKMRQKAPKIEIFKDHKSLGIWESAPDLEEWSLTLKNNLPVGGRFKKPRMGLALNYLKSGNINKSCRTGKPYKGLIFKFVNS